MEQIKVKYLVEDLVRLEKNKKGDWIDLRCAEDIELYRGQVALIPLGVAIKLPEGYEAHIVPRSSTFKSWGIIQTNSMGVVDECYCGDNDELKMPVIALRNTKINKNDRICQFRIVKKMDEVALVEVTKLGGEDRGGFGSTGKN